MLLLITPEAALLVTLASDGCPNVSTCSVTAQR